MSERNSFGNCIDLCQENRAWKFPSVCKFGDNGSTKTTCHLGANGQYPDTSTRVREKTGVPVPLELPVLEYQYRYRYGTTCRYHEQVPVRYHTSVCVHTVWVRSPTSRSGCVSYF